MITNPPCQELSPNILLHTAQWSEKNDSSNDGTLQKVLLTSCWTASLNVHPMTSIYAWMVYVDIYVKMHTNTHFPFYTGAWKQKIP